MAWVEFHASRIKRLNKFVMFRNELGLSMNEALGILGSFWGEVIEVNEDGDITGWTPEYFAELIGLKACLGERVFKALITYGWIDLYSDGTMLVHDWLDTAGRYLEAKYRTANPEKLQAIKDKHLTKSDFSLTLVGQPNLTLPNLTKKHMSASPPVFDFEAIWEKYPNHDGKKLARRSFNASVKTQADYDNINKALENYLKSEKVLKGFIKNGSTWFNNWADWIENPEKKVVIDEAEIRRKVYGTS